MTQLPGAVSTRCSEELVLLIPQRWLAWAKVFQAEAKAKLAS